MIVREQTQSPVRGARLLASDILDQSLPKAFRDGTHRAVAPAETLARVRPHAKAMGITRLGNVTGLDRIGIPVAIAVRPNSCSVSVTQGKGLGLEQAMASALMETVEQFHGEDLDARFRLATHRDLSRIATVVDPDRLGRNGRAFDPSAAIDWIEGWDLLCDEPCWVPAEVVHTDYTVRERPDSHCLLRCTNGLGAGNHMLEALSSAVCEVIERDAASIWGVHDIRRQAQCHLDPGSIDDADARALLDRYAAAGISVRLWNVTSDIGIAAFVCDIREMSDDPVLGMRRFRGAGCHPDRGVALIRALTEAAQTRLTYIVGSREDLPAEDYAPAANAAVAEALLDVLQQATAPHGFGQVPNFVSDDVATDVDWALARLRVAGIDRVVAVDLTDPALGIPVVRVVVPGLEGDCRNAEYMPGLRATGRA